MEHILLAYGILKETATTTKTTKTMVRSPDGDTDLFNNVTEDFQEDTFTPFIFIIFLDFERQWIKLKKMVLNLKKLEAKYIPPKLWLTQTTQMI